MIDHNAAVELWDRYKRGERNVFTRRLYTLQGQQTFDEIRRKYRRDAEFKETVDRYIDEFERLLGEVNEAYSNEDERGLRALVTPEMFRYFDEDLSGNAKRGLVDRVSDVKLLQGDLAEAWREGSLDYATVAMRFSLINALYERATGRVVEGSATQSQEVVEHWTFVRERGGAWRLSGIQSAA